jgi:hypothetical protein
MRKAQKLPLFLGLFEGRGDNGLVAQGCHGLHDAVRDLDGIPLSLFGGFNHHCRHNTMAGCLAEIKFQSSPLPEMALDCHCSLMEL